MTLSFEASPRSSTHRGPPEDAEEEAEENTGTDEPFINTHGQGAEETIDSGQKFEEEIS